MVKGKLQAANPSGIEMTLTITMPMEEWVRLSQQLGDGYPAWKVGAMITSLTTKAVTHFDEVAELDP